MINDKQTENINSWLSFAQGYLHLASLGCQELTNNKYTRYNPLFSSAINQKMKYRIPDIYIPIIYNIKHGVECFLKTLQFFYKDEHESGHDIAVLFSKVKNDIEKDLKKIQRVIEDHKDNFSDDINIDILKKEAGRSPDIILRLEELINKYYRCDVLKKKIGEDFIIRDIKNTTFRYPDNDLKISLDFTKILKKISKEDIKDIENDIKELILYFNTIGFSLFVFKTYIER